MSVIELEVVTAKTIVLELTAGFPGIDGTTGAADAVDVAVPTDTMPLVEAGFGPVGAQNLLAYLVMLDAAIAAAAGGALDPELEAIAGLVSAADKLPYFTGSGTAALANYTAFGRTITALTNAAGLRTAANLGNSATLDVGTTSITVAAGDAPATAISAHLAASDPHADRAFATAALLAHVSALDPHGDRAFATTAVNNSAVLQQAALVAATALLVPKTTTVNGHALSANVVVTKADVGLGSVTDDAQVKRSEMGVANGVAQLDSGGKVPVGQLPSAIMEYQGTWNATTNTPTLADGSGSIGDVFRVTVAGTRNLGSGAISFAVGDYAVLNASLVWEKSDTTDSVPSVFGRTGDVAAANGDYTASQVTFTPSGLLVVTGATVQAAIASIDAALDARYTKVVADARFSQVANNLSDLANPTTARNNLVLGNVNNTSDANKPVSTAQAAADALRLLISNNLSDLLSPPAARGNLGLVIGTDVQAFSAAAAFHTDKLSAFAATTSAELAGIITNETGTGQLVFGTAPNITAPTGIVKGDVGLGLVDNTSDASKPVSTAQATALALRLLASANLSDLNSPLVARGNLGLGSAALLTAGGAGGALVLDGGGKVPASALGASVMEYQGTWDASTNTPTLANGTGSTGDVYRTTVAGSVNFGAGAISFDVGDLVIYNGSIYEKSDTTDSVPTVFGRTGNVVAAANDYSAAQVSFSALGLVIVTGVTVQAAIAAIDAALDARYTKSASDGRYVQLTRTINGFALSSNVTLAASDVGADASGAAAAAQAASQPLDTDLSNIAALATASFGRSLLTLVSASALRIAAGLGTAAQNATGDFDVAGAAATAQANAQSYADNLVSGAVTGLNWKAPVRGASSIPMLHPPNGAGNVDGITVGNGDRVLLTAQGVGSENGLWVVNLVGNWTRPTDFDTSAEAGPGVAVAVTEGTSNGDSIWLMTTNAPITLGTTALAFSKVPMSAPVTSVDGATGAVVISVTTAKIVDAAVTNIKLANMANGTIKARITAGTGVPEDATGTQVTALLDLVTPSGGTNLKGLMSPTDKAKLDGFSTTGRVTVPGGNLTHLITQTQVLYSAVTTGANANIVTLCAANAVALGFRVTVRDLNGLVSSPASAGSVAAAAEIQVKAGGTDTINGVLSATTFERILDPFGLVILESDGTSNWTIITLWPTVRVERFTSTISSGFRHSVSTKTVHVELIGGGGGGGSGERVALAGTSAGAGGGGEAGGRSVVDFAPGDLANLETVTVGTGGAGGVVKAVNGAGNSGASGNPSKFTSRGTNAVQAAGGAAGSGGTGGSAGAGGVSGSPTSTLGAAAAGGGGGTSVGTPGASGTNLGGGGGGGGGTNNVGNAFAGAAGGAGSVGLGPAGAGAASGIASTTFGATPFTLGFAYGGGGGAGSDGKTTGSPVTAQAGGSYGAGGGGGGAGSSVNGSAGGAGAAGIVVVTVYR